MAVSQQFRLHSPPQVRLPSTATLQVFSNARCGGDVPAFCGRLYDRSGEGGVVSSHDSPHREDLQTVRQPLCSFRRLLSTLHSQVIQQPMEMLKLGVPTGLYIVHNTMHYTAATHLDAPTFMVSCPNMTPRRSERSCESLPRPSSPSSY